MTTKYEYDDLPTLVWGKLYVHFLKSCYKQVWGWVTSGIRALPGTSEDLRATPSTRKKTKKGERIQERREGGHKGFP